MSVSSFEAPVLSQSSVDSAGSETPASLASLPRVLAVIGMFAALVMLDVAVIATHSLDIAIGGIFFFLIFVAFFVGLIKFATTKVTLAISNEGIVERRKNAVQAHTIAWQNIDEYLYDRDPQGNVTIRLRLKPDGKKLRYTPRSAFAKSKTPFEAFAARLTARIDHVNEVVDARSVAPASGSLLESAPAISYAPQIKKGTSFYDRRIAKVIGVVFGSLYVLGLIGVLATLHGSSFPYRFIYLGGFLLLYNARVFSKPKKR